MQQHHLRRPCRGQEKNLCDRSADANANTDPDPGGRQRQHEHRLGYRLRQRQARQHASTPGTWSAGGPSPDRANYKLVKESAHFAFYSDENVSDADLKLAVSTLENTVWQNLFNSNLFMPEPFYNTAAKIKPSIHIHSTDGLSAGGWARDRVGMWIGPGALKDHWGLTHEFTHAWQFWMGYNGGLSCPDSNTCGWIAESHANYTPHQLPEYKNEAHCSEMLANAPHL